MDREQTSKLKAALTCFGISILVIWGLVALQGCAGMLKTAKGMNAAAASLHGAVMPIANAECKSEAVKCKAASAPDLESCAGYKVCRDRRRIFVAAINGVHVGAAELAVLSELGDEKGERPTVLEQIKKHLKIARDCALNAGWLKRSFFDGR